MKAKSPFACRLVLLTLTGFALAACGEQPSETSAQTNPEASSQTSSQTASASTSQNVSATTSPVGYTTDIAEATIPDSPVSGEVGGYPFVLEKVERQGVSDIFTLKSENGQTVFVFLFLDKDESLAGKSWKVAKSDHGAGHPHVHLHFKNPDNGERQAESYAKDFVLELQIGDARDGAMPARIYCSVPDDDESYIAGTFELPTNE